MWNGDFAFTGSSSLDLGAGAVTLGTNRIVTVNAGTLTVGGVIGDGGGAYNLTKAGTGTLELTGANTFSGVLWVSNGALKVPLINDPGVAGPLGMSSLGGDWWNNKCAMRLGSAGASATLLYAGASGSSAKDFGIGDDGASGSISGVIHVDGGTNLTLNGMLFQAGNALLTKTGGGTLTLAGTRDNLGLGVAANAGTLVLGKTSNGDVHSTGGGGLTIGGATVKLGGTGGDQIYDDSYVTVNSGTFDFNGTHEAFRAVQGSGGTILNNGGGASTMTVGFRNTGDATYSGVIADRTIGGGTMSLVKIDTGTQTLSGNNTYTGPTTIKQGTVKLDGNTGHLADNSGVTFAGTATFNFDNTTSAGARSETNGTLTLSAGEATIQSTRTAAQNVSLTFSSLAARAAGAVGNFVNSGGTVPGQNQIILRGQPLGFINQGAFYGGANYAYMNAAGAYVRAVNYATPDPNSVSVGAGTTVGANSGKHVQTTGAISGQTNVSINTLKIGGAFNFTLAASQTLTLSNGGLLKAGNNAASLSGGTGITTGGGVELVVRTDQASDSLTISTPILSSTTGGLTKSGAGTLILSGTHTYSGDTTVNAGTLELQTASGLNDPGKLIVNGTATVYLNFTGTDTIGGLSFDGGATWQATGTWGGVGSGASHEDSRLTGNGMLNVVMAVTVTAATDAKTYDGTTGSTGMPAMVGTLLPGHTVTLTQAYADRDAGTGKTLTPAATIKDAGNNDVTASYTITYVNKTDGAINQAPLTITALPNTKTYDGTTTAAAVPTVTGLQGADTATGLAETYDTQNAGTGKTLSVSAYTVNDGNGGANYTVNTVTNTAGVINKATPIVSSLPTASAITSGQALSDSTLTGGAMTNAAGAAVDGAFAFTSPTDTPGVGTADQSVTFTPDDTVNYETVVVYVSVTVENKPTVWITSIRVEGTNVVLEWPGSNAWFYTVESTPSLAPLVPWSNLLEHVHVAGWDGTMSATNDSVGDVHRFYRVKMDR